MQFIHKALDEVRRIEAISNKHLLAKTRYLWLYSKDRLTEEKQKRLDDIMTKNSALALAYQMKENIKDFFLKTTREEAEIYLQTRCDHALTTHLHPCHEVVKTLKKHRN